MLNMTDSLTFAITGASGFLGSHLSSFLEQEGYRVIRLSRNLASTNFSSNHYRYNLDQPINEEHIKHADVLVHCAYDFKPTTRQEIFKKNVEKSVALFQTAKKMGIRRLIFISSLSAFEKARSYYGQAKYATEELTKPLGVISIRPGLLYDINAKGLVGSLQTLSRKLPIVPLIGNGHHPLYICKMGELCKLILSASTSAITPSEPLVAACDTEYTLKTLIRYFAATYHTKPLTLPIPTIIIQTSLFLAEKMGISLPFRSDSIKSLLYVNEKINFTSHNKFNVEFTPLEEVL